MFLSWGFVVLRGAPCVGPLNGGLLQSSLSFYLGLEGNGCYDMKASYLCVLDFTYTQRLFFLLLPLWVWKACFSRRDRDRCVCVVHVSPVAVTGGPIRYLATTVLPNLGHTDINVGIFVYRSRCVPVFQCFTVIQRVLPSWHRIASDWRDCRRLESNGKIPKSQPTHITSCVKYHFALTNLNADNFDTETFVTLLRF